jgi:hypothetical protein
VLSQTPLEIREMSMPIEYHTRGFCPRFEHTWTNKITLPERPALRAASAGRLVSLVRFKNGPPTAYSSQYIRRTSGPDLLADLKLLEQQAREKSWPNWPAAD